jgi:hypothetical protein
MKKLYVILGLVAIIGFCYTPVMADEVNEGSAGLGNQVKWVAPQEFQRVEEDSNDSDWNYESDYELYDDGDDSDSRWRAAIHLPDGARIVSARWYLYDDCADDPDEDSIDVWIFKVRPDCGGPTRGDQVCYAETTTDSGYTCLDCDFNVPGGNRTVRNNNGYYLAAIEFDTDRCGDWDQRFSGLKIVYRLQISPPPAAHTFWDVVPGDFGYRHIEALAASGITEGCDPHNYCPDDYLTRAQMAVFLARALGLYWAP